MPARTYKFNILENANNLILEISSDDFMSGFKISTLYLIYQSVLNHPFFDTVPFSIPYKNNEK